MSTKQTRTCQARAVLLTLIAFSSSLPVLAQTPWRIINGSLWDFSLIPTTTNSYYFVSGIVQSVVTEGGILVERLLQKVVDPDFVLRGSGDDISHARRAQAILDRGAPFGAFLTQDEKTRNILLDHVKDLIEVIYIADATNSVVGSRIQSFMLPRRTITLITNGTSTSFPTYIIGSQAVSTKGFSNFTQVRFTGNRRIALPSSHRHDSDRAQH